MAMEIGIAMGSVVTMTTMDRTATKFTMAADVTEESVTTDE
jgi:hypothetical protein